MKKVIMVLWVLCITLTANAQLTVNAQLVNNKEIKSKNIIFKAFIDSLKYEKSIKQTFEQMFSGIIIPIVIQDLDPTQLIDSQKQKVNSEFSDKFMQDFLSPPNMAILKETIIQSFTTHFTIQELKNIKAFYETHSGKKYNQLDSTIFLDSIAISKNLGELSAMKAIDGLYKKINLDKK